MRTCASLGLVLARDDRDGGVPATPWLSASIGSRWAIFSLRPTSAASRSAPGA